MSFKSKLGDILMDDNGKLSSKRVITLVAFILVSIAFVANLIFGNTMEENILTGMIEIVWAGLGVTVGERLFSKREVKIQNDYGDDYRDEYNVPNRRQKSSRRNRNDNQDEPSYRNTDISNPDE